MEATRKPTKRHPKPRPRARGPRQPKPVIDYIADLDQKGVPPKQILSAVNAAFPNATVSSRALTRYLSEIRDARHDGQRWVPREPAEGVDVALTIPALAQLIAWSEGRRRELTIGEAQRITFVRRAVPDIPIHVAFNIARLYGRTTPENVLDSLLAYAPWRGDAESEAYEATMGKMWLPHWSPPIYKDHVRVEERDK